MFVSSTILSNLNTADHSCLPPDYWLFQSTPIQTSGCSHLPSQTLLTVPVYHHTTADCSSLPPCRLLTVPTYYHTHCELFQFTPRLMTVPFYHHTTADYSSLHYNHTTADCSSLPSQTLLTVPVYPQTDDCSSLPPHNCWLLTVPVYHHTTADCSSLPPYWLLTVPVYLNRHCRQFQPSITDTHRQQSTFKDSDADCSRI